MYKTNVIPKKKTEFDKDVMYTPSAEALICLTCPLPKCSKMVCKRYNEEKKKIKEKS